MRQYILICISWGGHFQSAYIKDNQNRSLLIHKEGNTTIWRVDTKDENISQENWTAQRKKASDCTIADDTIIFHHINQRTLIRNADMYGYNFTYKKDEIKCENGLFIFSNINTATENKDIESLFLAKVIFQSIGAKELSDCMVELKDFKKIDNPTVGLTLKYDTEIDQKVLNSAAAPKFDRCVRIDTPEVELGMERREKYDTGGPPISKEEYTKKLADRESACCRIDLMYYLAPKTDDAIKEIEDIETKWGEAYKGCNGYTFSYEKWIHQSNRSLFISKGDRKNSVSFLNYNRMCFQDLYNTICPDGKEVNNSLKDADLYNCQLEFILSKISPSALKAFEIVKDFKQIPDDMDLAGVTVLYDDACQGRMEEAWAVGTHKSRDEFYPIQKPAEPVQAPDGTQTDDNIRSSSKPEVNDDTKPSIKPGTDNDIKPMTPTSTDDDDDKKTTNNTRLSTSDKPATHASSKINMKMTFIILAVIMVFIVVFIGAELGFMGGKENEKRKEKKAERRACIYKMVRHRNKFIYF